MKKLLLVVVVVLASVLPVVADVVIKSDNFNTGWGGPDSLGSDAENRLPINWDRYADAPGSTFLKISMRGFGDNAMVLSQWGSNCGITAYDAAAIPAGTTSLKIDLETKSEGWGWILTLNAKGIFKDALGGSLGTAVGTITPLKDATTWTARTLNLAVPAGAASVVFQLENYRGTDGENGAIMVDNFVATAIPEPITIGLLSLGALLVRGRKA